MCGIVGMVRFDGEPVRTDRLRELCDRMVNRGPDGDGYFVDGAFGMGMRRLAIIDLAGGDQPIFSEDGRYAVMQNGEIYNFLELRAELESKAHRFRTRSDTEVLVHLFEERGTAGFDALNGMYAFALWDRVDRRLVVCRDRVGVKPLYYAQTDRCFLFASDLRLMRMLLPSAEVDRDSVLKYLIFGYVPHPHTILQSVRKLDPGSFADVRDGQVSIRKYWSLDASAGPERDGAAQIDELRALFDDAVTLQMRSDVPVGVFLSGGLDSSGIVSAAQKLTGEPMKTLSVAFERGSDERVYARAVSAAFGTEHHEIEIRLADVPDLLDALMPYLDEPIADSSIVPTFAIARAAAGLGLRVVLTGAGGDELFGGYHRYLYRSAQDRALKALPRGARALLGTMLKAFRPDVGYRLADARVDFLVNITGVSLALLKRALRDPRDFARVVDICHEHFHGYANGGPPTSRQLRALDFNTYLVGDILGLTDKMTMAASLEARVPFLDHRFVERSFAVPERDHYRAGLKSVERQMFAPVLPPSVVSHRKEGFAGPTSSWMGTPRIREVTTRPVVERPAPWLDDVLDVRTLADAAGADATRYEQFTMWSLYVVDRWSREHLGGGGRAPLRRTRPVAPSARAG